MPGESPPILFEPIRRRQAVDKDDFEPTQFGCGQRLRGAVREFPVRGF